MTRTIRSGTWTTCSIPTSSRCGSSARDASTAPGRPWPVSTGSRQTGFWMQAVAPFYTRGFAGAVPDGEAVGVDREPRYIDFARRRAASESIGNVRC